jgi:hypothetical protein
MGKHETGYERVPKDLYTTPHWVLEALIQHLPVAGKKIWEPAAGTGQMVEALRAAGAKVLATDIHDYGFRLARVFDFTAPLPADWPLPDGIITNSPYGDRNQLAVRFIELGLQRIGASGFLALLLPNDFDSAVTRRHLFADCSAFSMKIVLTRRIVWFAGPGAAPKENHSWFVWGLPARARQAPIIVYAPRAADSARTHSKGNGRE